MTDRAQQRGDAWKALPRCQLPTHYMRVQTTQSIAFPPTDNQTDGVRYEGLTEAEWCALLQYLQRCAWKIFNRPGHEVPLGEFEDAGMEALCYALEHADVPRETPWLGFARHIIYHHMLWRFRRYKQWRFPVAG